ncbi:MAG TPA: metalloregulator ArsR/SmtB family transcription factor [bacterium]|nr:metalloregulator ArsR/SmtB family transcription factor [bacterium]
MQAAAALFKALADPIRLRLAVLLAGNGETCVCQLASAVAEPECKISRHLGVLRAAGMVRARRHGTWMYYRLVDPRHRLEHCLQECFRDCLNRQAQVTRDRKRLLQCACAAPEAARRASPRTAKRAAGRRQ